MMGEHSEVTEDMMQPALTDPLTTTVVTTKDANENNTKSGKWERSHLVTRIFFHLLVSRASSTSSILSMQCTQAGGENRPFLPQE